MRINQEQTVGGWHRGTASLGISASVTVPLLGPLQATNFWGGVDRRSRSRLRYTNSGSEERKEGKMEGESGKEWRSHEEDVSLPFNYHIVTYKSLVSKILSRKR